MLNLLKSDLYRLVHGKSLWVLLAITIALIAGAVALVWFTSTPAYAELTGNQATQNVEASDASTAERIEAFSNKQLASPVQAIGSTLMGGCFLTLMASLAAAFAVSADFNTGFVKNILSCRPQRGRYFAEKLALVALISAAFVLVAAGWCLLCYAVAGFGYIYVNSPGGIAAYLLLTWITVTAFGWIAACASWIAHNLMGGVLCASFVSSSLLATLANYVCQSLSPLVPALGSAPAFFLSSSAQLLSGSKVFSPTALWASIGYPAQIAIVTCLWLAACALVAFALSHRKDV